MRGSRKGRRRPPGEWQRLRNADEAAAASSLQAAAALASLHLPHPGPMATASDFQDQELVGAEGARGKRKGKRKWGFKAGKAGAVDSGKLPPGHFAHRRSTCRGGVGSIDEVLHGEVGIRSRFSAARVRDIMRSLTPRQQGYVAKYGFEHLSQIGEFSVHDPLAEWIMGKINPPFSELRINTDKTIIFSKPLVQKVLGVPAGGRPFVLHGQKTEKIKQLRILYLNNGLRATIPHAVSLLKNNEDEESFMRTFLLIVLAAVLTPTTGNTIDLDYLWAFEDMSAVQDLDWSGHIMKHLMEEVRKFQYKSREEKMTDFWVGGCLPLLMFRDRTPYSDNPIIEETEVAEDDLHIPSKDYVLSGQWELEAPEERIYELGQGIQPEVLAFAEASIDNSPPGRNGGKIFASCERGSSSHCRDTAKAAVTSPSSEESGEDSAQEYESSESDDHLTPPEADYGVIFRNFLSGAQIETVNTLIHKIQPGTVVFVATMRKCDVQLPSPLLIVSKERTLAAAAHFPHESGTVTLEVPGKSEKWQPRFFVEKDACMLAGNWLDFVCNNQVQEKDICVFVPAKEEEESKFMVHIISAEATRFRGVKRARPRHDSPVVIDEQTANPGVV